MDAQVAESETVRFVETLTEKQHSLCKKDYICPHTRSIQLLFKCYVNRLSLALLTKCLFSAPGLGI